MAARFVERFRRLRSTKERNGDEDTDGDGVDRRGGACRTWNRSRRTEAADQLQPFRQQPPRAGAAEARQADDGEGESRIDACAPRSHGSNGRTAEADDRTREAKSRAVATDGRASEAVGNDEGAGRCSAKDMGSRFVAADSDRREAGDDGGAGRHEDSRPGAGSN